MIAVLLFSIPLSTYITTSSISEATQVQMRGGDNNNFNCDKNRFIRYVGVGRHPILTRMEVTARVCWREFHLKRNPGQIVQKKSRMHVNFYNTSWGDTGGWHFNSVDHRTRMYGAEGWDERLGVDSWTKQCLNILGQSVCGPTANFVPVVEFLSPYLTEPRMHNGIHKNWTFMWYCGEINGNCGSFDNNVYIKKEI